MYDARIHEHHVILVLASGDLHTGDNLLVVKEGFFFAVALRPNAGHGLLILGVSRSHNDAPQAVGLLWTSNQLVAETST